MTEIVFGAGAIGRASELMTLGAFVVTDPGIVAAGHLARLEAILAAAGIRSGRYDQVRENPTEGCVEACLAAYAAFDPGRSIGIVALGGGSCIDVAKGCAMLAQGGGRMRDYIGRGAIDVQKPRVIAIPTTAGTGSEVQSFALIANADTGQKMACGGSAPAIAILDPELTVTQPRFVAACTGLDTLAHAVESLVTRSATAASRALSREAFVLVERNLPRVFAAPDDLDARGAMLQASAKAGLAIEQSMLGAAHAMANPLTKHHGVTHGQAVGVLLPHVVRYNRENAAAAANYADLAAAADLAPPCADQAAAIDALIARLEQLIIVAGFEPRFAAVPADSIEMLAAEAGEQWTARCNPRDVDAAAFRGMLGAVAT